jgi:hypothetical protein
MRNKEEKGIASDRLQPNTVQIRIEAFNPKIVLLIPKIVILSAAKNLNIGSLRFFAALRMTILGIRMTNFLLFRLFERYWASACRRKR